MTMAKTLPRKILYKKQPYYLHYISEFNNFVLISKTKTGKKFSVNNSEISDYEREKV